MSPAEEVAAIDLLLQLGNSYGGLQPFPDCLYSPYSEWRKLVCPNSNTRYTDEAYQEAEELLHETIREATRLKLLRLAPKYGDDCSTPPWWHWYTRRTTDAGRVWLATLKSE
jgi:hypothetical protein